MTTTSTNGTTPLSHRDLKIGILVPSSNTALEPITVALLSQYSPFNPTKSPSLPNITVHFSRLPVLRITLSPTDLNAFSTTDPKSSPIIAAAKLLADAGVDVIGWSGTSAGWLGFESDVKLCKVIEAETGVKATTSTLALNAALKEVGVGQGEGIGIMTPYLDDVQRKIEEVFQREAGVEVVSSNIGVSENYDIAAITVEDLKRQMADVVGELKGKGKRGGGEKAMVVSPFCTNLKAAQLAAKWEEEYEAEGLIVMDTVATVVWECLRILGRPKGEVKGWGKLFDL